MIEVSFEFRSLASVLGDRYNNELHAILDQKSEWGGDYIMWMGMVAGAAMAHRMNMAHIVNEEEFEAEHTAIRDLLDERMQDPSYYCDVEFLVENGKSLYSTGGSLQLHKGFRKSYGPISYADVTLLIFRPLAESAPADYIFGYDGGG